MDKLDIRDISIINAFPVYNKPQTVITIGCGSGRIEWYINDLNYDVITTDLERMVKWEDEEKSGLIFKKMNILDKNMFISPRDIVICAEVLEHIKEWRSALLNLIALSNQRIIITVPYKYSFNDPSHVNHWDDNTIREFKKIALPYSTSISKIRTKPEDVEMRQYGYLIIIDKLQKYNEEV